MAESRAISRLRAVLDAAARAGDHGAWLTSAQALHAALERQEADSAGRADLRSGILRACEDLRRASRSRTGRLWACETTDSAAGPLLRDLLDDGSADAAGILDVAEASRARVLGDALAGCFHGESGDPREPALAARVAAFAPDPDADDVLQEMRLVSAVRPMLNDRDDRRAALRDLEALYASTTRRGFEGGAAPSPLAHVQRVLGTREVLVEYLIPNHPLHPAATVAALVVTRDDVAVVPDLPLPTGMRSAMIGTIAIDGRAPVDASPLGDLVVSARRAVQGDDAGRARAAGRLLHEVLIEPVAATGLAAGRDHWIVVPHRQLHPVPWMALVDADGSSWLESATITVCPSASVWAALASQPRQGRSALALGDPLLGYAGMPALPEAAQEVQHLAAVWRDRGWPVDVRVGGNATLAALVEGAPDSDLVHLATHGSFPRADAAAQHQLLLAMAPGSSGRLTLEAMRALPLHRAWCLTLSVCNGGLYLVGPGDEPLGLVAAALEAGATSVIAAQWAVEDAAGRRLVSLAVDALADMGPSQALRRAALARSHAGAPAREWAAFVSVGSGRGPRPPGG